MGGAELWPLLQEWILSAIYAMRIVMVHAREGWFVVAAGRNGVEYSVLLNVVLLCIGMQHPPAGRDAS